MTWKLRTTLFLKWTKVVVKLLMLNPLVHLGRVPKAPGPPLKKVDPQLEMASGPGQLTVPSITLREQ